MMDSTKYKTPCTSSVEQGLRGVVTGGDEWNLR